MCYMYHFLVSKYRLIDVFLFFHDHGQGSYATHALNIYGAFKGNTDSAIITV